MGDDEPEGAELLDILRDRESEDSEFPDPLELLAAADDLFTGQGVDALSSPMVAYRDPHDEITLDELRSGDILMKSKIPLQGRYEYWAPNHYNFFMLGYLLATSERGTGLVGAITSPLLPMPGGIISSDRVIGQYRARTTGTTMIGEDDWEEECYVVRLHPHDSDSVFYKSVTYYISMEEPHRMRGVRATFDDERRFIGTGWGTFYYKDYKDGIILPFVGEGEIHLKEPDRIIVLKGKWRDYKLNEDASINPDAIDESSLDLNTDVGI